MQERLIDANALKSELCSGCSTRCVTVCETIRIINKQPTIKAKPMRHGLWIPCSERLPEQSEEGQPPNVKCSDCVLVAARDWIGMAYYVTYCEESQWEFADAQNKPKIDWVEVTHWMPIPEPPEKE